MNHAIILAAGHGTRAAVPHKQYALIGGHPLLWYSLKAFSRHERISKIVLVIREEDKEKIDSWLESWNFENVDLAFGGKSRQASASAGFQVLNSDSQDIVLFHNSANPFVTQDEITQVIEAANESAAAFVAHPATDTLKQVKDNRVTTTVNRSEIWQAQTPQALRADLYQNALVAGLQGTDEMSLIESMGVQPVVVQASVNNKKITTQRDLEFARFLIEGSTSVHGIGQDSHRFDSDDKGLALGGLTFEDSPRIIGNSDGDVMIHALCNAILQVIGEKSLGSVADEMVEDGIKDSAEYLKKVLSMMAAKKFKLTQVGFQLEGATPKIDPISPQLKQSLAELLSLDPSQIGITATTGEDLTPFGRGEGLQCFASVTLSHANS
jgi:2-C-methyl-D-erythritol 4-phosphate cytidylyltransferase/2-C-methyl-D-erythritol 2,4-cyclodiphosphate synthase